jgi:hypothetical protein
MPARAQSWVGQLVGQVSHLPRVFRRTGPRPLLHALNQTGPHRVSFDVGYDALKFPIAAHPVIVGFILPEIEIAQLPLLLGREQRVDNNSGDARICQPLRTRARQVQFPVEQRETFALRCRNSCRTQISDPRQRAIKPPRQKDCNAFRVQMRQSTTIEVDRKTVETRSDNSHHGRSETCPTL